MNSHGCAQRAGGLSAIEMPTLWLMHARRMVCYHAFLHPRPMRDVPLQAKNADAQVTAAMTRAVEGASTPRASETAGSEGKYQHADAGEAQALLPAGAHRSDGSASKGPAADLAPSAALSRTDASHAADERNANVLASASPSPWLGRLVTEPWFGNAATMLVLANMAVMCMPYQVGTLTRQCTHTSAK